MAISDVLEVIHCAFPGELTRRYWDAEKHEVIMPAPGTELDVANSLALWLVHNVVRRHNPDATFETQVSDAAELVRDTSFILADVAESLERTLEA